MPKFQDTTPVPHSAGQMFDLVADVERYPEFLPMCEALRVKERRERDETDHGNLDCGGERPRACVIAVACWNLPKT